MVARKFIKPPPAAAESLGKTMEHMNALPRDPKRKSIPVLSVASRSPLNTPGKLKKSMLRPKSAGLVSVRSARPVSSLPDWRDQDLEEENFFFESSMKFIK